MQNFKIASLILLAVLASHSVAAERQLLQRGGCAAPSTTVADPPAGALLYLSVRGKGTISYQCGPDGKPTSVTAENVTATSIEKYTAKVFINSGGYLQFDVTSPGKATNSVVTGGTPTVQAGSATTLPKIRWEVQATDGATNAEGGIPPIAYVVRDDDAVVGRGPCPASGTTTLPIEATYNFYTCEVAFLGPGAAPVAAPVAAPASPVALSPAPAPVLPAPAVAPVAPVVPVDPVPVATTAVPPSAPATAEAPKNSATRVASAAVAVFAGAIAAFAL